ncbi:MULTISPECIES: hypothetical protein [Vibrio]|uniref:hypothetical protein n=1 Tax=Vibrio TaxID=662 RepID=UPI000F605A2C|nr:MULTISPECIES: hypothetical protein [Vibrio]MDA0110368.1 hypothetical protein [Vibrio sp. La 4.2.2]USD99964.1 hypothetical protein JKJ11_13490 [Vibrio sp. SCSIO 43133]
MRNRFPYQWIDAGVRNTIHRPILLSGDFDYAEYLQRARQYLATEEIISPTEALANDQSQSLM